MEQIERYRTESAVNSESVNAMTFDLDKFDQINKFAQLMAGARTTIPAHLAGKPGDCMAVIMQSLQWGMNPYAVAQKTFLISGTLGYEAQLVNAVVNCNAPIQYRFKTDYFGDWTKVIGKFKTATGKSGSTYQKPDWSSEDEKGLGIRIWTTLRGEEEPRVLELLLSQATVRNSTLWASDPKQQLYYLAVKRWTRMYCPDVLMGVYTPDELSERRVKNVTPKPNNPQKGTKKLESLLGVSEDVKEDKTQNSIISDENNTIPDNREPTISDKQLKRLHTIATKSGKSTEYIKSYLSEMFGVESSRDIPCSSYEDICDWIENSPND